MVEVELVAVLFRLELRRFPLSGIDPITCFGGVRFGIGNVNYLVSEVICLVFPRPRVHVRKGAVLTKPRINCFAGRHAVFRTNVLEAHTRGNALANDRLYGFRVIHYANPFLSDSGVIGLAIHLPFMMQRGAATHGLAMIHAYIPVGFGKPPLIRECDVFSLPCYGKAGEVIP